MRGVRHWIDWYTSRSTVEARARKRKTNMGRVLKRGTTRARPRDRSFQTNRSTVTSPQKHSSMYIGVAYRCVGLVDLFCAPGRGPKRSAFHGGLVRLTTVLSTQGLLHLKVRTTVARGQNTRTNEKRFAGSSRVRRQVGYGFAPPKLFHGRF